MFKIKSRKAESDATPTVVSNTVRRVTDAEAAQMVVSNTAKPIKQKDTTVSPNPKVASEGLKGDRRTGASKSYATKTSTTTTTKTSQETFKQSIAPQASNRDNGIILLNIGYIAVEAVLIGVAYATGSTFFGLLAVLGVPTLIIILRDSDSGYKQSTEGDTLSKFRSGSAKQVQAQWAARDASNAQKRADENYRKNNGGGR